MTATANYLITNINGYEVQIYNTYDGDVVYIVKDGIKIDDFRTIKGEGLLRATEKVAELSPVAEIASRLSKAAKLAKGRAVLMSDHIKEVEVRYLSTITGIRYYEAKTWAGRHVYQVKLWSGGESCNCASQSVCRHIIKARELDAEIHDTSLQYDLFSDYKAHRRAA